MHETSEINGLYVGRRLLCGKPYLPTKGKRKIQRFCSPQCRNSCYCNEDKDVLNRFADKSKMTRQHGNIQRTPNGNLKPLPFKKNRNCVGILNLV